MRRTSFILVPITGKNRLLKGVLTVEYVYETIKQFFSREGFLKLQPGKFWLYPLLWAVDSNNFNNSILSRLALPAKQMFGFKISSKKVLIQDETRNPTLSYKDRATQLVALKAMEHGITKIAAVSTGNAASSLAGICARLFIGVIMKSSFRI